MKPVKTLAKIHKNLATWYSQSLSIFAHDFIPCEKPKLMFFIQVWFLIYYEPTTLENGILTSSCCSSKHWWPNIFFSLHKTQHHFKLIIKGKINHRVRNCHHSTKKNTGCNQTQQQGFLHTFFHSKVNWNYHFLKTCKSVGLTTSYEVSANVMFF